MFNENTVATLALFRFTPALKEGETTPRARTDKDPIYTGNLKGKDDSGDFKINVSAWAVPGQKFLRLSFDHPDLEGEFQGSLNKTNDSAENNSYYGSIKEKFADEVDGKMVYSDSEWKLKIKAVVAVAASGRYIRGDVFPWSKVPDRVVARDGSADDLPF